MKIEFRASFAKDLRIFYIVTDYMNRLAPLMDKLIAFMGFLFDLIPLERRLDYKSDLRFASLWRKLGVSVLIIVILLAISCLCLLVATNQNGY